MNRRTSVRHCHAPLCTLLFGALLFASLPAQAAPRVGHQPPAHAMQPPPRMPGGDLPPEFARLQLSDEQEDRIFALLHEQAPLRRQRERSLQTLQHEMQQLARADTLDTARLRKLADDAALQRAELDVLHVSTAVRLRAVLTAAQRKTLDEALLPPPRPAAMRPPEHAPRTCPPSHGEQGVSARE